MKPIEVNADFHHLAGESLYEKADSRFQEYRRKWKEWPENFQSGEFPLFIDIEVTSSCNLKCSFCLTALNRDKIAQGFIAFDTVKKIIDEGQNEGVYGVKFNIRGEPLLHPEIDDFVRYAKERGLIDVYFNTNAMLLTQDVSERLIAAGLDRISISVEGFTRDIYERHRVGANFEIVLKNIMILNALRKKRGVLHPKIRIQTVMLSDIEPIFEEYKKFWTDWAEEVAYLDCRQIKERNKGLRYCWSCPQIWQRMAVWWNGTIMPCNQDDDGLLALGNIKDTTIKEAWQSKELNRIRGMHKEGLAHQITACDGCYLRYNEIKKQLKKGSAQ